MRHRKTREGREYHLECRRKQQRGLINLPNGDWAVPGKVDGMVLGSVGSVRREGKKGRAPLQPSRDDRG